MEEMINEQNKQKPEEHTNFNSRSALLKDIIDKWAQEHLDENGFVKAGQEDLDVLNEAIIIAKIEPAIFQDQIRANIALEIPSPSARTKKTNFLSTEDIAHMKDLRQSGASQMEIARKFGVSLTTIRYHLIADVAADLKERGKEYSKELFIDPAKKAAYLEKMKKYAKEKYANDPEWKKRIRASNKKWLDKKKAERIAEKLKPAQPMINDETNANQTQRL